VAYATSKKLQTIQNMYIVNLAVTDVIIGVSSIPFYGAYTILYFTWPFGYVFCKVWCFIDFWACAESSLTIILISYDRLLMVTDGIAYNQQQTKKRALIKIAVSWFLSSLLYGPAIIGFDIWRGYSILEDEDCNVEFATDATYTLITAVIEFAVPFTLLAVFNVMLYWNIRKRSLKVRDITAAGKRDVEKSLKKDKKAAKALAALVLVYAVCWTPYTVTTVILSLCEGCINEDQYEAFNWLLWANSSFNACIYAYTNVHFRARFKAMLCGPCRKTKKNVVQVKSIVTSAETETSMK
jgi:histamine receptor H3